MSKAETPEGQRTPAPSSDPVWANLTTGGSPPKPTSVADRAGRITWVFIKGAVIVGVFLLAVHSSNVRHKREMEQYRQTGESTKEWKEAAEQFRRLQDAEQKRALQKKEREEELWREMQFTQNLKKGAGQASPGGFWLPGSSRTSTTPDRQ